MGRHHLPVLGLSFLTGGGEPPVAARCRTGHRAASSARPVTTERSAARRSTSWPGVVGSVQHIAKGANPADGADMMLVWKNSGVWIISAGSIAFNGALTDPAVSQLWRKVVDRAAT